MVDILRPDYGQAWASAGEKLAPAPDKVATGWVQEMMPFQYENFLQARQDEALLYLLQKGVPEYSATQEYTANKSIVQYQGNLYLATATATGVLPTVTASWRRLSPTLAANGTVSVAGGGTGATSAAQARANLGLGDASTATLPTATGVVVKGAGETLISRLLTGTSGDIVITNPDGVAGNINIGVGSNVAKTNQDSSWTSKGGITLPRGSSGERGVEVPGKIRYNTELQKFEGYNGTSWNALGAVSEVEITTLSGDGTTTIFTLNTPAFSDASTDVYIGGVWQNKGTYSVSGTQITFSEAPTIGAENVQVVSRKVVDLGLARASQISLEDSANIITAVTVEGALREIVETSGKITPSTEWSEVPSRTNPRLDLQAQALVNRTQLIKDETEQPSGNNLLGGFNAYSKLRNYSGQATRVQFDDGKRYGIFGTYRKRAPYAGMIDDGGMTIIDADGNPWERVTNGPVVSTWFDLSADIESEADDYAALQAWQDAAHRHGLKAYHPPLKCYVKGDLIIKADTYGVDKYKSQVVFKDGKSWRNYHSDTLNHYKVSVENIGFISDKSSYWNAISAGEAFDPIVTKKEVKMLYGARVWKGNKTTTPNNICANDPVEKANGTGFWNKDYSQWMQTDGVAPNLSTVSLSVEDSADACKYHAGASMKSTRSCLFQGFDGFRIYGTWQHSIHDNAFSTTPRGVITTDAGKIGGNPQARITTLSIKRNQFDDCWIGILADTMLQSNIDDCNVMQPCIVGVYVGSGGAAHTKISNNYFEVGHTFLYWAPNLGSRGEISSNFTNSSYTRYLAWLNSGQAMNFRVPLGGQKIHVAAGVQRSDFELGFDVYLSAGYFLNNKNAIARGTPKVCIYKITGVEGTSANVVIENAEASGDLKTNGGTITYAPNASLSGSNGINIDLATTNCRVIRAELINVPNDQAENYSGNAAYSANNAYFFTVRDAAGAQTNYDLRVDGRVTYVRVTFVELEGK